VDDLDKVSIKPIKKKSLSQIECVEKLSLQLSSIVIWIHWKVRFSDVQIHLEQSSVLKENQLSVE
tara:strand:- start:445 stop:639 length:195 start_codon:yes stop_codon:yes gene_type:complete